MLDRHLRIPIYCFWRWHSSSLKNFNKSAPQTSVDPAKDTTSLSPSKSREEKLAAAVDEEIARRQTKIDFKTIKHPTKIPLEPVVPCLKATCARVPLKIDSKTIQLLERLSLVDLDSKEALKTLEDSIEFAEKVVDIPTKGVEPMYTVLEDRPLKTRPDQVTEGNIKEAILKNASLTEEDYFVAPPGNIPLEQKEKKFD